MKTTIDENFFKKWKNKDVVMNCKTMEDASKFCKILAINGLTWCTGESYFSNKWPFYKENTCYVWNEGKYGPYKLFKKLDYTILNFENYTIPENI